jgi:hypothetical protein
MKTVCVLLLTIFALGCGNYHSPMSAQLTALSPSSTSANGPQFMLTVTGSGFNSHSVVYFNTAPEVTAFVSGTSLTATIPATAITTTGMKPVYVVTTGSGYGSGNQTSNAMNFTVN